MTFPAKRISRTLKLCIEESNLPSLMLPHCNFSARLDVDRKDFLILVIRECLDADGRSPAEIPRRSS